MRAINVRQIVLLRRGTWLLELRLVVVLLHHITLRNAARSLVLGMQGTAMHALAFRVVRSAVVRVEHQLRAMVVLLGHCHAETSPHRFLDSTALLFRTMLVLPGRALGGDVVLFLVDAVLSSILVRFMRVSRLSDFRAGRVVRLRLLFLEICVHVLRVTV